MHWSAAHTVLFIALPLGFVVLSRLLARVIRVQSPALQLGGFLLAGYAMLGTYAFLSQKLTTQAEAGVVKEETVQLLTDAQTLTQGKVLFDSRCVTCHGAKGEGAVGPNLTDEYWMYGGNIKDIFRTIRNGIPNTPMIAWKHNLSDEEQQAVANYVYSLYGTRPPNAKPPQGFIYVRPNTP